MIELSILSIGACWTFATAATIESLHEITTGKLISLSEQQILDCNTQRQLGCNGGFVDRALKYVEDSGGLTDEKNYPYVGRVDATCKKNVPIVAKIGGYKQVPIVNEAALQEAVAQQPVAAKVSSTDYQHYKDGVFKGPCSFTANHWVTIVGFDTASDGTPYWLIKNSWSAKWGDKGYIKFERNIKDRRGLCCIACQAFYPTK
ncbi:Vignain-like protein [Drosera capensis]